MTEHDSVVLLIDCGDIKLTVHYLICEYRILIGAADPTFKFAGAQARMKAQLLREAVKRGVVMLTEQT